MTAPRKPRIDQLLVERGLVESREKARALILAGEVLVNGQKVTKAGHGVASDCLVEVAQRLPYVSRGGVKLAGALDHFCVSVESKVCMDVGASTGGFTDCLLQRGAERVHAVDVGSGQIAWKIRTDPRVVLHENTNARYLKPPDIGEPVDLAVCDVSFISVTLILPAVVPVLKENAEMVILVKPQFEAGRGQVGKGGIVRDPELHQQVCAKVAGCLRDLGFDSELIESPITGAEGNREFLLYGSR